MEGRSTTNPSARSVTVSQKEKALDARLARQQHHLDAEYNLFIANERLGKRLEMAKTINRKHAEYREIVADQAKKLGGATKEVFGNFDNVQVHPGPANNAQTLEHPILPQYRNSRGKSMKRMFKYGAHTAGSGLMLGAYTTPLAGALHLGNALAVPIKTIPPLSKAVIHKTRYGLSKLKECLGQACNQLLANAKGRKRGKVNKGWTSRDG
jgi:hypothetical protein